MNIVTNSPIVITVTVFALSGYVHQASAQPRVIEPAKAAVKLGMKPIIASAASYVEQKDCFTCHHQALPVIAAVRAEAIGVQADRDWLESQRKFTADFFLQRKAELANGRGVPGGAFTAGYALAQFIATSQITTSEQANLTDRLEATDELLGYLLKIYKPERPWKINTIRPPLESSDFTATALAIAALSTYELAELMKHVDEIRIWYGKTKADSAEDRAFQLMGWYWLTNAQYNYQVSGVLSDLKPAPLIIGKKIEPLKHSEPSTLVADKVRLRTMITQLKQRQHEDGGWAQTKQMESDAYATGLTMAALSMVQPELVDEKWYLRGVKYLLETQQKDGTWRVLTRSEPIQEYFESGFPHKEDQFISIAASCWSVIALSQYVNVRLNAPK